MKALPVALCVADKDRLLADALRVAWTRGRGRWGGAAASVRDTLALVRRVRPALVPAGVDLPGGGGLALAAEAGAIAGVRIVLLAATPDDRILVNLGAVVVAGFLLRSETGLGKLVRSLREAARGRWVASPGVVDRIRELKRRPIGWTRLLSARDQELAALFGAGLRDDEVAERTGLSPASVRTFRYRIRRKLGLRSSVALVVWATEQGFATPRDPGHAGARPGAPAAE